MSGPTAAAPAVVPTATAPAVAPTAAAPAVAPTAAAPAAAPTAAAPVVASPSLAGPAPTLAGPRLVLRAYRAADAEDLQREADNANVAKTLRPIFPHPYALKDAQFWVVFSQSRCIWAITVGDRVVGNLGLLELSARDWGLGDDDDDDDEPTASPTCIAELGYWLGEEHWGKGYAREAVNIVLDHLKGHGWLVLARAAQCNPASQKVLFKSGFEAYRQVKFAEEPHPVAGSSERLDVIDFRKRV